VDVAELVHGIVAMIRQTVGPSITVQLHLAAPCWAVECDPNQLENALLNLAINARDAMLPAGGTLVIETEQTALPAQDAPGQPEAAPGDFVRLTVRDHGQGMPADVLARAFEPFFTTKPVGQGTGLGLSQVYGFVNQSKGIVRLESAVGEGTSVHLLLPRHVAEDDVTEAAAMPSGTRGSVHGAKVLVVEDEAPIRAFLAEALGELGCQVSVADDGAAGLLALREIAADLDMLVADVGLPGGLDGRQLADAARTLLPRLPVLLITGYGDATAGAAPPDGVTVLGKPFTLEDLIERVVATLGGN
jgi:CheY-like chemotaxis protein